MSAFGRYGRHLRSLHARVLLALLLLGALPAGAVSLGAVLVGQQVLAEQSAREVAAIARGQAGQSGASLQATLSASRALAALPEIESLDPAAQRAALRVSLLHDAGTTRLAVYDLAGQPVAAWPDDGATILPPGQPFLSAVAREAQEWQISVTPGVERAALVVYTPVRDAQGHLAAVLGAVVDLANWSFDGARTALDAGGSAAVVDAAGRLLIATGPAALSLPSLLPVGSPPSSSGSTRYVRDDAAHQAGYAAVPGTDWTVIVTRPDPAARPASAPWWWLASAGLAAGALLASVGAGLLASLLTRRRPLRTLAQAASAMAAGDFSTPLPDLETRDGEVGELVGVFATMRQSVSRTLADLRESETRYRRLATRDPLTHLANRSCFREQVAQALASARRSGRSAVVFFLDLDGFKPINDTLGHASGDQLLVEVAHRLLGMVRVSDTAARLGGDEFALLLPDAAPDFDPVEMAERVLASLRPPVILNGCEVFVRASIGIAAGSGQESADDLLRNADVAMYAAKAKGKGRYEVFAPRMYGALLDRMELEADLRRAVAHQDLHVQYQPVVDLRSGRVAGVEALARWTHPERGSISPDTFIPLAEQSGMIVELGSAVLHRACRQAAEWLHTCAGNAPEWVSVNLSARQLQHPDLIRAVAAALLDSGLEPRALLVELTEGSVMDDPECGLRQLQALKALGVRLAIDDFGTGRAPLSFLQRFPVDFLKMDQSFLASFGDSGAGASLARATLGLGKTLGLRTVAKGVESRVQWETLRMLGCDLCQGYFLSPPVDPPDVSALCASPQTEWSAAAPAGPARDVTAALLPI